MARQNPDYSGRQKIPDYIKQGISYADNKTSPPFLSIPPINQSAIKARKCLIQMYFHTFDIFLSDVYPGIGSRSSKEGKSMCKASLMCFDGEMVRSLFLLHIANVKCERAREKALNDVVDVCEQTLGTDKKRDNCLLALEKLVCVIRLFQRQPPISVRFLP
jgi:hypothetical protein